MLSRPGVDFTGGEFYVAEAKDGGVIRREVAFENRFDLVIFQVLCEDHYITVLCKAWRQRSTTQCNTIQRCNQMQHSAITMPTQRIMILCDTTWQKKEPRKARENLHRRPHCTVQAGKSSGVFHGMLPVRRGTADDCEVLLSALYFVAYSGHVHAHTISRRLATIFMTPTRQRVAIGLLQPP
jgi:hypothetical protein